MALDGEHSKSGGRVSAPCRLFSVERAQEECSQADLSLADQALVNRDRDSPAAQPTNGPVPVRRQVVHSRAWQTWAGCPWHCCGLPLLPDGDGCQGDSSTDRRNPSTSLGQRKSRVPEQPPAIPEAHSKMQSQALPGRLGQGPGISVFAASQTPNRKPCWPFFLQRPGQPASGSQALSFWFQGRDPLLTLPKPCPVEGPPQTSPGALCPPLPRSPLIHGPPTPKPTVPMAFVLCH